MPSVLGARVTGVLVASVRGTSVLGEQAESASNVPTSAVLKNTSVMSGQPSEVVGHTGERAEAIPRIERSRVNPGLIDEARSKSDIAKSAAAPIVK